MFVSSQCAAHIRSLTTATRFTEVFEVETTASTNLEVAAAARQGAAEGMVLVADAQTAGRGRCDRVWESPAGKSVAMSILLRPTREVPDWGWLSLLAGMAVTSGLKGSAADPGRIRLKWPNDVLVDGRKVCGILSEIVHTQQGPASVIGIGINLSLEQHELPVPQATSLKLAGLVHDRDQVVAGVLRALEEIYAAWLKYGPPVEAYSQLCASIGVPLMITAGDECVHGVGEAVDRLGRLVVSVAGRPRAFTAGDVVHASLS